MNIHFLILYILCFNCALRSDTSPSYFIKASPQEISLIKQELYVFYAKELFTAGLYQTEEEALKNAIEECESSLDPDSIYYNIATEGESNSGYFIYSIKDKTAFIDSIFLKENFRGLGIGKQVLQNLEKELMEQEIYEIELYVFAHNQAAYTLYKKMGYLVQNAYYQNSKFMGSKMKKVIKEDN